MSINLEQKITNHNRLAATVKTMASLHRDFIRSDDWNFRNGVRKGFMQKIGELLHCRQEENPEIDRIISDMMDDVIQELSGIVEQDAEKIAAIEKLLSE